MSWQPVFFHYILLLFFFIVWQGNVDWGQNWILKTRYVHLLGRAASMLGICGWFPGSYYAIVWVFWVFLNKPCGGCLLLEAMESTFYAIMGCIQNHCLYPHSLFHSLFHYYSPTEGVNKNEREKSDTECATRAVDAIFSRDTVIYSQFWLF